jgi:NAD-dependent SIR2 family protein deacetylase
VHQAKRHGAMTIEINTDPTESSGIVDIVLQGKAEDILPALSRVP